MTKLVAVGLTLAALLVSNGRPASAQTTAGPAGSGHWEGAITVQGKELRLEVDLVARSADKWEGSAGFPDMNAKGLMLSAIAVQGQAVTFAIKGVPGDPTFKGTLSKDSKTLSGDFIQGPVAGTFTLAWKGEAKLEAPPKNAPLGKDFEGTWEGTVEVNGNKLRLEPEARQPGRRRDGHAHRHRPGRRRDPAQRDRADRCAPEVHGACHRRHLRRGFEGRTRSPAPGRRGRGSMPLNLKRTAK